MLDDLKMIHQRDSEDSLGVAEKQWEQLLLEFNIQTGITVDQIQNVVLAGMGGSALAATFVGSWPELAVPFEITRGYEVPAYVGENTLFIASSYSGNTEETLAALEDAENRQAKIAVIAGGGKLKEIAQAKDYPLFELPDVGQPRMAVFSNLTALVHLFVDVGLLEKESIQELRDTSKWLSELTSQWAPDVATANNQAKQLAQELMGKSVVIYAGPKLFPAAYKWKINVNENAKNVAWCNYFPEFNHNEFIGWSSHPTEKPYALVELRSDLEHERIGKRFEISDRLLSGKRPSPNVVEVHGDTVLKQLVWAIALGDFTTLYLALLNGLNPSPVELVEKLKIELKK